MFSILTRLKFCRLLNRELFSAGIRIDPFLNDKNLDSSKLKEFADDNYKFDENGIKFPKKGGQHCGEKEKLLVTSNFSFSHSVFEGLLLQTLKNKSLFGNGLMDKKPLSIRR